MEQKFDIFVAHSSRDRDWAGQLAQALRQHGLSVWLYEEQVSPGEDWSQRVLQGLQRSSDIVFLVGRDAARSNWVGLELGMALAEGKRIIPIVGRDVPREEIPGPIRLRQYLERMDPEAVAQKIAHTVADQVTD